ncbi:hypothetical protein Purlil1_5883 [Purpureocillium lilacinum]|uniref:Uncharacterized protein n=1 Tax=Purpureocillium lilacinum TaxID=33203 RepID=A0ABR0C0N4_PURLI|nr:hypothetical protein Purlil1_5883 [Purpureocillium lilacinum]
MRAPDWPHARLGGRPGAALPRHGANERRRGGERGGKKKVAVTPSFPIFLSSALHPLTVLLLFRALQQLFARDTGQNCPLQLLVLCASAARPSTKNPIPRVRHPSLSTVLPRRVRHSTSPRHCHRVHRRPPPPAATPQTDARFVVTSD